MNNFVKSIRSKILVYDGSKGTMLQRMGLPFDSCPEAWNIEHPEKVKAIYQLYANAGSDVIQSNTFGANRVVLEKFNLADSIVKINTVGIKLALEVAQDDVFVAVSIGPTSKLMEPAGDLTFENAYEIFKEQIEIAVKAGANIINFETFTDLNEIRAAIIAAKENSNFPIIASMTFENNGYTLMGNSPYTFALVCEGLGVDCIGVNCSSGPSDLVKIISEINSISSLPISVKPNAGIPVFSNNIVNYSETPENFAAYTKNFIENGVRLIGGCCGTTPEFITEIRNTILNPFIPMPYKVSKAFICSATKYLFTEALPSMKISKFIDDKNVDSFKNAYSDALLDVALDRITEIKLEEPDVIYVQLDSVSKEEMLPDFVDMIQTYSKIPIIIKTNSPELLESALRIYTGKAGVLIEQNCSCIFELITETKRYGGTIIGGLKID